MDKMVLLESRVHYLEELLEKYDDDVNLYKMIYSKEEIEEFKKELSYLIKYVG